LQRLRLLPQRYVILSISLHSPCVFELNARWSLSWKLRDVCKPRLMLSFWYQFAQLRTTLWGFLSLSHPVTSI
jgi:hypothetical protein